MEENLIIAFGDNMDRAQLECQRAHLEVNASDLVQLTKHHHHQSADSLSPHNSLRQIPHQTPLPQLWLI